VNVLGSMIFAGMSGTAQADAAGLGIIEIRGDETGRVRSGLCRRGPPLLQPLSDPSFPFGHHGDLCHVDRGFRWPICFWEAFIPGIIMGFSLMGMIYWQAKTGRIYAPGFPPAASPWSGKHFGGRSPPDRPHLPHRGMLLGVATPTELGPSWWFTGSSSVCLPGSSRVRELLDILADPRRSRGLSVHHFRGFSPSGGWWPSIRCRRR